jgi:hypothetical protein
VTAKTRNLSLLTLLAISCLLSGCERSTHVTVKGGTTPIFVLSGSGKLSSFAVYSPDFAEKAESPWDENFALWKIKPSGEHLKGTPVGQLERITYGVLPDGYTQVKPQVGSASPSRRGRNTSTKWEPLMPLAPQVTSKSGIHKPCRLRDQTHVSGTRARSGFAFDAPSRCTITAPDTTRHS